jgi:hypothetical protein
MASEAMLLNPSLRLIAPKIPSGTAMKHLQVAG